MIKDYFWQLASIFVLCLSDRGVWGAHTNPVQSWPAEIIPGKRLKMLSLFEPAGTAGRPCGWCSLTILPKESSECHRYTWTNVKKEPSRNCEWPLPNCRLLRSQIQKVRSAKSHVTILCRTAVVWLPVFQHEFCFQHDLCRFKPAEPSLDLWLTLWSGCRWAYRHASKKSWPIWAEDLIMKAFAIIWSRQQGLNIWIPMV